MDTYEDIYSDDFFESDHEEEFSTIEVRKTVSLKIWNFAFSDRFTTKKISYIRFNFVLFLFLVQEEVEKTLDDLSASEDHGDTFDSKERRKICFDNNTNRDTVSINSDSPNVPTPTQG